MSGKEFQNNEDGRKNLEDDNCNDKEEQNDPEIPPDEKTTPKKRKPRKRKTRSSTSTESKDCPKKRERKPRKPKESKTKRTSKGCRVKKHVVGSVNESEKKKSGLEMNHRIHGKVNEGASTSAAVGYVDEEMLLPNQSECEPSTGHEPSRGPPEDLFVPAPAAAPEPEPIPEEIQQTLHCTANTPSLGNATNQTDAAADQSAQRIENNQGNPEVHNEPTPGADARSRFNHRNQQVTPLRKCSELIPGKKYQIINISRTNTQYGPAIRAQIQDDRSPTGQSFVYLPVRFRSMSDEDLTELNSQANTSEGLFLVYKGKVGRADMVELT